MIRNLTCKDKLEHLNLYSLERRRVTGDLIEVFKWVKGFNKMDINKILIIKEKVRTRTNGFKLDKFRFRKDIFKNWFTNGLVEEWNKLSKHVVSATTVNSFKKRLDISMDKENGWEVLGEQELLCVDQVAFCWLLVFYVLMFL